MSYMSLVSGRRFEFVRPDVNTFDLRDIVISLSNKCRFNGQIEDFYSVAQHSVLVSYITPPEYAFYGLMHDAHEAMCGDAPAKMKPLLPDYTVLEHEIASAVRAHFELAPDMPEPVYRADKVALAHEFWHLRGSCPPDLKEYLTGDPVFRNFKPLEPRAARELFLSRFEELAGSDPQRKPVI